MNLADLLIIGLLLYGAYAGYYRGLPIVAADAAGFFISTILAALSYRQFAPFVGEWFRLIPSFADVVSFSLIFVLTELVYALSVHHLLKKLPHHLHSHRLSQWSGAVLSTVKMALVVAIGLIIYTGLPIDAPWKSAVANAKTAKLLMHLSGNLERQVNRVVGSSITDTLNFFTVRTTSSESIDLGFKTTAVKTAPNVEAAMLGLINHERTSRGLKPLVANEEAREVARAHSRDMFARGYFSHINPDGKDPFDRMEAGGVKYRAAGENLALAPTLELAHNGLMNSPGHRANILSPDFGTVGIGVIDGGRYGLMFTQNFTN